MMLSVSYLFEELSYYARKKKIELQTKKMELRSHFLTNRVAKLAQRDKSRDNDLKIMHMLVCIESISGDRKKLAEIQHSYDMIRHFSNNYAIISQPPGLLILIIAEFLCSRKTYERVFMQNIMDMREEYFEALAEKREQKARWVLVRGYGAFVIAVCQHIASGVSSKIVKTFLG